MNNDNENNPPGLRGGEYFAASSGLSPGQRLGERYVIEGELGRGGVGIVYLARDLQLRARPVVIKVLLEGLGGDGARSLPEQ